MMAGRSNPAWKIGEPLALKDALRTVRFMAQRGRRVACDAVPPMAPQPIDKLIAGALAQADALATRVEREAARFVYSAVGWPPSLPDLRIAEAKPGTDVRAAEFAEAAYRGLMTALELLQADGALVSESAAKAAYAAVAVRIGAHSAERWAALLVREMLQRRVVREVHLPRGAEDDQHLVALLALFALMIWLLSDRNAGEGSEALEASVALTVGLRGELAAAGGDVDRLERLLKEFRHHV